MNIAHRQVSCYADSTSDLPREGQERATIEQVVHAIKTNGFIKERTEGARRALAEHGKKSKEYSASKKNMVSFTVAGVTVEGRKRTAPIEHSGLVLIDVDTLVEGETATDLRDTLAMHEATALAYVTTSGLGAHAWVAIDPLPQTREEHVVAWTAAMKALGLDDGARTGDPSVKNRERIAFVAHDTDVKYSEECDPVSWEMPPPPEPEPDAPSEPVTGNPVTEDERGNVAWVLQRMTFRPGHEPTQYNDWLGVVSCLKANGWGLGEVMGWVTTWGYRTEELGEKWGGLPTDGDGYGPIFAVAERQGIENPARRHGQTVGEDGQVKERWALAYDPEGLQPSGDAQRLLEDHANELLIVQRSDGTGADPYVLERGSGIWRKNIGRLRSWHDNGSREYLRTLLGPGRNLTQEVIKRAASYLIGTAASGGRGRGFAEMLAVLPAVVDIMQRTHTLPPSLTICKDTDLDQNMRYIGAPNGAIDLDKGTLVQPNLARKFLITKAIPDAYHPYAQNEYADMLLGDRHPGLSPAIRQDLVSMLGFALNGQPWNDGKLVVCYDLNIGKTGKSTLFACLVAALGPEIVGEFQPDAIRRSRAERSVGSATPFRLPFARYRIIYCEEVQSLRVDSISVKALVNTPTAVMRDLNKPDQSRKLTATPFMLGNGWPSLDLTDTPLAERTRPLRFDPIPQNKRVDLKREVSNSTIVRQAIVAILVRAARDNKAISPMPDEVKADLDARRADSKGEAGEWIEENVINAPGYRVSTTAIWLAWGAHNGKVDVGNEDEIGTFKRIRFTEMAAKALHTDVVKMRIDNKMQRGFEGFRLRTVDEVAPMMPIGEETEIAI